MDTRIGGIGFDRMLAKEKWRELVLSRWRNHETGL